MINLANYKPTMAKIAAKYKVDLGVGFSMFKANIMAGVDNYKCEDTVDYAALKEIFDSMTEEEKTVMYDEYFASK